MPRCLVSLGSNLGDRQETFDTAIAALAEVANPGSLCSSSRRETVPIGGPREQDSFVNAVVSFHSRSEPHDLLAVLQRIEQSLDRERSERWDARTLDLDLLLYGETVLRTPDLRLPHPRMTFRPFVLEPACEIAGHWYHPEAGMTLDELLSRLRTNAGELRLGAESSGVIEAMIKRLRPDVPCNAGLPPRLVIDSRVQPFPLASCGPRLVLADCPREHWHNEVLAAVECVWPTMP